MSRAASDEGVSGALESGSMGRAELISRARDYARAHLLHDTTGHGMDHANRVARMAERLAREEGVDPLLPVLAAYLHDTADEKLVDNRDRAVRELRVFLEGIDLPAADAHDVVHTVTHLSFADSLPGEAGAAAAQPLSRSGQITQDADRLDAIGAIGVVRAVYYGGAHGARIYDPAISPRVNLTRDEYRDLSNETVVNHFYEKLLTLKDTLNTDAARHIAEQRHAFMVSFLEEFKAEWEGRA